MMEKFVTHNTNPFSKKLMCDSFILMSRNFHLYLVRASVLLPGDVIPKTLS